MKIARVIAFLLILLLFTVGSLPETGAAFPGVMHWIVHVGMYALIAFTVGLGWQKWPAYMVVALVAMTGVAHESSEIVTHHHALEIGDLAVNALGALVGTLMQRLTFRHMVHRAEW
jgi:hypothetical protein